MLRRSIALPLLWFVCASVGGGCTAQGDHASESENRWVIRPNGTDNVATVTLDLPEGFNLDATAGGFSPVAIGWSHCTSDTTARWRFTLSDVNLEPGKPVPVASRPSIVVAHLDVCG